MKLLIVDDEEDLRELISSIIKKKLNIDTVTAESIKDAIDIIETNSEINGIICDYHMKKGTGGDLFVHLKSKNIQIPFILCSGDSLEMHPEFRDTPPAGFLQKPFLLKDIVNQLESIFGKLTKS